MSSQDTNVVTGFFGPASSQAGKAMNNSQFLQQSYPTGTFNPGTFVPAYTADSNAPTFTQVPTSQGGLTFSPSGSSSHSVRGIAFDSLGHLFAADEAANRRLFQYDANQVAQGNFQANSLVQDDTRLDKVSGIAVDPAGNLYTCSRETSQVYQWSSGGDFLVDFAGPFSDTPEQILAVLTAIEG